jgi:hypothetical protein
MIFYGVRRFIAAFAVRDHPEGADICRELISGMQSDIEMSHSKGKPVLINKFSSVNKANPLCSR